MNLGYFVIFITLKSLDCYNPKRHTQVTSTGNFKNLKSRTSDPVIPARYKITSTSNYEDPNIQSFPGEYFPEVEYPESVVDSAKPFYISASPFPNDVKSTFNSLAAKRNGKAKSTIDYSWTQNEKNKEKVTLTSQKVGENEITDTKGNEINSNDKSTNESLNGYIAMLGVDDNTANDEILVFDNHTDKLFTNWSSTEQSSGSKDVDYVIGFINDLDEVMKNLTTTEAKEPKEGNNSTEKTFENECSDEFQLSSMTPHNNDTIIELNGNSFLEEEHPERIRNPLFEDSDTNETLTSLTSLFNAYITNATSVEDMLTDFCSIGTVANETNTSCTET